MKVIVFLFMLISSNFVFAGEEASYFPKEIQLCSSCIMKLPKHFTKSEYCSIEKNKEKNICTDDIIVEYSDIHQLDAYTDCKVKTYNAVLEKFRKRNVKIIETDSEDLATDGDEYSKYDSDDTYKYTMCLTAKYGRIYVYKEKQESTKSEE